MKYNVFVWLVVVLQEVLEKQQSFFECTSHIVRRAAEQSSKISSEKKKKNAMETYEGSTFSVKNSKLKNKIH